MKNLVTLVLCLIATATPLRSAVLMESSGSGSFELLYNAGHIRWVMPFEVLEPLYIESIGIRVDRQNGSGTIWARIREYDPSTPPSGSAVGDHNLGNTLLSWDSFTFKQFFSTADYNDVLSAGHYALYIWGTANTRGLFADTTETSNPYINTSVGIKYHDFSTGWGNFPTDQSAWLQVNGSVIPEPSFAIAFFGLTALVIARRKRGK